MIDLALDNRILITSKLDAAIQELDLLFNTECTELIGDTDFGVSMHQFLWTLTPTTNSLKSYISDKLSKMFYLKYFNYDFDVEFLQGEYSSIYKISIVIYIDNDKVVKKEYEFR